MRPNPATLGVLAAASVLLAASLALYWRLSAATPLTHEQPDTSIFDLPIEALDGRPSTLADYRGHVALVVNVASACGLAYQYPKLDDLYHRYRDRGFVVLAFPSNDFWQEPKDDAGIQQFCTARGVSYPVFGSLHVRGPDRSPLYTWLSQTGETPIWNFAKYLIGRDGRPRAFFGSLVEPDSDRLAGAIEQALADPGFAREP